MRPATFATARGSTFWKMQVWASFFATARRSAASSSAFLGTAKRLNMAAFCVGLFARVDVR